MLRWNGARFRDSYEVLGQGQRGDARWKSRISGISQMEGFPYPGASYWLLPQTAFPPPQAAFRGLRPALSFVPVARASWW
jgi:hypothetical protein